MPKLTVCMHRQFSESQSYCPDCGLSRSEVLVAACEPFLKDGETPAECIARNRRDVDGCLTMLVAEKRKTEALRARLAEAEALLREARACLYMVQDDQIAADIDAFLSPDSAPAAHGCKLCGFMDYEPGGLVLCSREDCPGRAADQPPAALTCEHGNMVGGCVACALQPGEAAK